MTRSPDGTVSGPAEDVRELLMLLSLMIRDRDGMVAVPRNLASVLGDVAVQLGWEVVTVPANSR